MSENEKPAEDQPQEEPKPGRAKRTGQHLKRNAGGYAKLVAAITALTAAVNGYLDLAKKNELVYQALASKVNHMSVELSEVKGQNQVILIFLAKEHGKNSMLEEAGAGGGADASPPGVGEPGAREDEDEEPAAMDVAMPVEEIKVTSAAAEPPPKEEKKVVIKAYQELPANVEQLVQEQKQLQLQEE